MPQSASSAASAVNAYRIGVVGPPHAGAGRLLSACYRAERMDCRVCARAKASASASAIQVIEPMNDESLHDDSHHSPCDVFSVVIKEKGPLGVKIAKHKKYNGFVCVKAFVKDPAGHMYGVEQSGKVCTGDLLVAVNRQNLLNMSPQSITDILRSDNAVRVLTFLRTSRADMDASTSSVSSAMGALSVSADEVDREDTCCMCSTWRTFTEIEGRSCCLEIVDIPSGDSSLSVLRSHMSALDGIVFVYSLEMMSTLLMLEKRYARALPALLASAGFADGMESFPLVVVGTAGGDPGAVSPVAASASPKIDNSRVNQRQMLMTEGNTFAEVWGAPPVIEAVILESVQGSENDMPPQLKNIFQQLIRRIDRKDDPSCFVPRATTSTFGAGFSYYLPMCFCDCAASEQDPAVDSSITENDSVDSPVASVAPPRQRKEPRRFRKWPGDSDAAVARTPTTGHPSEETSILSGASTKVLKYILSSCE
jgi:hypothetical protein